MDENESAKEAVKTSVPIGQALNLDELVSYSEGSVVSRTLIKGNAGTITLFAFAEGQGLSEHTAPFDAFVQIVDGKAELTIGGEVLVAEAGQTVVMPAGVPHSLNAPEPFKMLLTMIRK